MTTEPKQDDAGAPVCSKALLEMFDAHELEVKRMFHGRWLCTSRTRTGDDDTFYGDAPSEALALMIQSISNPSFQGGGTL